MTNTNKLNTVAFIPVKQHSEGCPGKVLEEVGGVSLLMRSVKDALAMHVDVICLLLVTTGDGFVRHVQRMVMDHIANDVLRQADFNKKHSCIRPEYQPRVILHCTLWSARDRGIDKEMEEAIKDNKLEQYAWVLLQPTSPFRPAALLDTVSHSLRNPEYRKVYMTAECFKKVGIEETIIRSDNDSPSYVRNYVYQGDRQTATEWFYHWDGNLLANSRKDTGADRVYGLMDVLTGVADCTPEAKNTVMYIDEFPYNMQVDTEHDLAQVRRVAGAFSL